MIRPALLSLLALAGCGTKAVETTLPAPASGFVHVQTSPFLGDLELHEYKLDNGMRLLVVPDASAPVVAYNTWFNVGSSDEEEGRTGLAHLFEHMMFKATSSYEDGAYMATLDRLGASGLNAWTWLDETVYVQSVPVDALPKLAEMESARMTGLILDQEKLDKEREVVINERRLRVDNDPDGAMSELLHTTAYTTHRYGWPTVGWEKDLDALTVEDCTTFYTRWYAPNNATLVMVGDVDPAEAAALVAAEYGDLAPSELPSREEPPEPAQAEPRSAEITLPMATDRISVAWHTPAGNHEDAEAIEVLDAILTAGRAGRLKRAMVDTGLAASVRSGVAGQQQPYLWTLDATARDGVTAEQLQEVLLAEVARVRDEGVTDAEVQRAARQVLASGWGRLDAASGKASLIGWSEIATGDWRRGVTSFDAIAAVTPDDVARVAAAYLDPNAATTVIGRAQDPADVEPELTDAPAPVTLPDPLVEARAVADAPALEAGAVPAMEAHGATILMDYDPAMPLIELSIGWPSGAVDADPGVANLAGELLLRGTERLDRAAFEEAVESLGARISVDVGYDNTVLHATVLREAWPELVALLTEMLTSPRYDDAELGKLKEEVRNQLTQALDNDGTLVSRAARRAVYGADHPYAVDPRGTRDGLGDVKLSALTAFRDAHLVSGGAVVAVAGAFDDQADEDVVALLAAIEGDAPALSPTPAVEPAGGVSVVIVDKPDRSQAQIAVASVGPRYQDDGWAAYYLGNEVFGGGSFSARLTREVRVQRGWSYFARGSTSRMVDGGLYAIRLAPGIDYAPDAVQLVLELAQKFHDEGPTADELEAARSAELLGAPFLADTAAKRVTFRFDQALTGYDRMASLDAYRDVTLDQAADAWRAAIDPGALTVVIVATADDVRDALSEVGEVTVVPYTDLL